MVVRGLVRRVVRGVVRGVVHGVGLVDSPRSGGQFFQLSLIYGLLYLEVFRSFVQSDPFSCVVMF